MLASDFATAHQAVSTEVGGVAPCLSFNGLNALLGDTPLTSNALKADAGGGGGGGGGGVIEMPEAPGIENCFVGAIKNWFDLGKTKKENALS